MHLMNIIQWQILFFKLWSPEAWSSSWNCIMYKTIQLIREDQVLYPLDRCFKRETLTKWQTKSFTSRKQSIPQTVFQNCVNEVMHNDSDIPPNPFLCYFHINNTYFTDKKSEPQTHILSFVDLIAIWWTMLQLRGQMQSPHVCLTKLELNPKAIIPCILVKDHPILTDFTISKNMIAQFCWCAC